MPRMARAHQLAKCGVHLSCRDARTLLLTLECKHVSKRSRYTQCVDGVTLAVATHAQTDLAQG